MVKVVLVTAVEGMDWHISHRTLGLVGYGNIARRVEKMMSGFDMKTLHYDPFAPDSTDLDTLLAESDYVSIHCPLTPETKGLIDARRLKLMKRNAIFVNTSRATASMSLSSCSVSASQRSPPYTIRR